MTEYKRKLLNNGREIPLMGLGTHKLLSGTLLEVIYNSIKDGVRLIDNAPSYFNEMLVGEGIKKALKEKICKREDLVVISKIWINEREDPESAIKKTFTIFNWIIWIFIWIIGLQEKIIGKILKINLIVSLFMNFGQKWKN